MNWIGGSRARLRGRQQQNAGLFGTSRGGRGGGGGRGFYGTTGGRGGRPHGHGPPSPPSSSNNDGVPGGRRRRLPYEEYDVSSDPKYERIYPNKRRLLLGLGNGNNTEAEADDEDDGPPRYRTVPLLDSVKRMFPNGHVLALQLSHQMEIDRVRGKREKFSLLNTSINEGSIIVDNPPPGSQRNHQEEEERGQPPSPRPAQQRHFATQVASTAAAAGQHNATM